MDIALITDRVRSLLRDNDAVDLRINPEDMLKAISSAVVEISSTHPNSCIGQETLSVNKGFNFFPIHINELRDIVSINDRSVRKVEYYSGFKLAGSSLAEQCPEYAISTDQPRSFYTSVSGDAFCSVCFQQTILSNDSDPIYINDSWILPVTYMSAGNALMHDADDEQNRALGGSFINIAMQSMQQHSATIEQKDFREPTERKPSA